MFIDGRQLNEPYLPAGLQIKPLARQTVPRNSIFVMGDNRPSSKDSTVFGPISKNLVVGRAFLRRIEDEGEEWLLIRLASPQNTRISRSPMLRSSCRLLAGGEAFLDFEY